MATRQALLVVLSGAVFAGTTRAQQTVLLQERKERKMKITPAFSSPSKGPAGISPARSRFTRAIRVMLRPVLGVPLSRSSLSPAPHGTRIRLGRL